MQTKTTIGEYEVYIEQTEKVNSRFNRIFLKLTWSNSNNIVLLGEWRMKEDGYHLELCGLKALELMREYPRMLKFIEYCQSILNVEYKYYYG